MATERKPPRVAIYDRPAAADRPRRAWLVWAVALIVAAGWGAYFLWTR